MKRTLSSSYRSLTILFLCFVITVLSLGQAGETIPLYTAIRENKVSVKITGSGIDRVAGTATRPEGSKPMSLNVPIGTLFVAGSSSVQDMVATRFTNIDLTRTRSAVFSVPVACSNISRDVPGEGNQFTVEESPKQRELQTLLPLLDTVKASSETVQAAVWIVTDNADYDDLGTLVESFGPIGPGIRVIDEPEAARAMMLIEQAKLDLRNRSIWRDRTKICEKILKPPEGAYPEIKSWCHKTLAR